jgi:hypothetical protein
MRSLDDGKYHGVKTNVANGQKYLAQTAGEQ